jgi:hypothetical protein
VKRLSVPGHVVFGLALTCLSALVSVPPAAGQDGPPLGFINKLGQDIDIRTGSRILADELSVGSVILPDLATAVAGIPAVPQIQLRGGNVQVNDPAQDYLQIFTGARPLLHAVQSETSMAAFGRNIVVTYNNSTGIHVIPSPSGPGLVIDRVNLSGFSSSTDGGQTWNSGFIPLAAGALGSNGDPSIGVDRFGVFYFANLAFDPTHNTVQVNKSTDGGVTWSPGVVVQQDDGSDKEWLAVGPDPVNKNRDNVYVTWTSFQPSACQLRFGRSTDGGVTWTAKTILVPAANANPTFPQNCLQFSNPTVDQKTGILYVPFLRFSNANQDFIQMLISEDAGDTFHFAKFNIPGAPDPTVLPITQPGEPTACGGTNIRLTIHGTANPGPGRFGYPRYVNASRLILQPAIAARDGKLYLAWNNSTSPFFGDPAGHSNILFIGSNDGGNTWTAPTIVNPVVATDIHHVMPALVIDEDPNDVHVTYYTQHSNSSVDLDMANSHDGGSSFPADRTVRVSSTSFDLPPSNIPLTNAPSFRATNFDRLLAVCYALGEYQSVTTANGSVYAAWGDMRNLITEPINALDPISGQTHTEPDVFFQKVKAQ